MKRFLAMTFAVSGLVLAPAGAAFAAGTHASCVGHEVSSVSPPGSSEELPGGVPELLAVIDAEFPGAPRGQVIRVVASLHEGSHEACDEALE